MDTKTNKTEESGEKENVWAERARDLLNEDPDKTENLINELKLLVKNENGLFVPDDRTFYLKFLRAGLHQPLQSFEIIKNFFNLKGKHKYFEVKTSEIVCRNDSLNNYSLMMSECYKY